MADQNMSNNNEINDTEMTDPRSSSELENQVQAQQEATMEEQTQATAAAATTATATMMNHNGSVVENENDYSSLPLVLSSTYRPRVTRMPPSFATATAAAASAASASATASLASSSSLFGTTQTSTVPSVPASITAASAASRTVTTDFTGEKKSATQKRKEIQNIMANPNLTDLEKRLMIQRVMDGRTVMDDSQKRKSDNDDDESDSKLPSNNNMNNTNPNFIMNMNGLTMLSKAGPAGRNIQNSTSNNNNNNNNIELDLTNVPPCTHYERNCYIIAPDCCYPKVFGCRLCHDEYYMNIASSKRAALDEGRENLNNNHHQPHQLNRFAIQEIICKVCHTRQPSKTNKCINTQCNVQFGDYHCQICNLWMSGNIEKKKPFHCDKCGFCRVGGQENFKHCDKCCMCISVKIYDSHSCMKDKYKNDCPVCREDLFSSRLCPQDLPCGHAIHAHCFRKLSSFDYRCPICKKTIFSPKSMASAWESRARDIALQPMPQDLRRKVGITCYDCEYKTRGGSSSSQQGEGGEDGNNTLLEWHFLGVQCPNCKSFNTVVDQESTNNQTSGGAASGRNNN